MTCAVPWGSAPQHCKSKRVLPNMLARATLAARVLNVLQNKKKLRSSSHLTVRLGSGASSAEIGTTSTSQRPSTLSSRRTLRRMAQQRRASFLVCIHPSMRQSVAFFRVSAYAPPRCSFPVSLVALFHYLLLLRHLLFRKKLMPLLQSPSSSASLRCESKPHWKFPSMFSAWQLAPCHSTLLLLFFIVLDQLSSHLTDFSSQLPPCESSSHPFFVQLLRFFIMHLISCPCPSLYLPTALKGRYAPK